MAGPGRSGRILAKLGNGRRATSRTPSSGATSSGKLNEARKPLGKVKSRTLLSKQYTTNLPGAPDGQYVVIQYKTAFEKKAAAVETVTPMLDKDKKWRVSGYYIK